MEKKRWMFLVFTLIVLLSFFGVFNSAAAGETVTLSLSHFFPASHFVHKIQVANWVKEVEEASGGAVKINVFPGGTLLKPRETYDGIVSGTADIGIIVFAYTRGRFPVMEGFELPGIYFGSCAATTAVAEEGFAKFNPKELSDTKMMYLYSVGPGSLYSKKKVSSLADLKGMRIRATGLTAKSIKAMGATPVAMPMPEAYEALSKGVVEGNIGPPEILKGWKQAEVTKYITILPPVYNALQASVMNLKKWNSLPEKAKKAIEKANEGYSLKAGLIWDAQMKANGIDYGVEKHGMKIVRLSEGDNKKAMALMQPLLDDYVARMNKKGLPGQDILDFVQERAAKYSKMYPTGY
jgi:TRAP-type C4-dicarboxylate transport system substrate-binding protein